MSAKPLSADEQADLQDIVFRGAAATEFLDFATRLVGDQERKIRRKMFEQIDSDQALDPIKAAQAWIELRAGYKLIDRIKSVRTAGITAQESLDRLSRKGD